MKTYRTQFVFLGLLVLVIAVNFVGLTYAGNGSCAGCGCHATCHKICRLVCTEKKVEIVCWGCQCEEFCLGGPSKQGCKHSEVVCDACKDGDAQAVQALPKKFVWNEWTPSSAKVYSKKKLMKKVITQKVPSYKWIVEDLCEKCEANCEVADIQPGVEIPRPPIADAKLKYGQNLAVIPPVKAN